MVTGNLRVVVALTVAFAASAGAYVNLPPATFAPAFIAFLLPTAALATYVLLSVLLRRAETEDGAGRAATDAIVFRSIVFVLALHGIVLVGLLGRGPAAWSRPIVARLTPIALGVALVAIGNLLPRVRPNPAIGIRTSRARANRASWMRINRAAGYVAVALGVALVVIGALVPRSQVFPVAIGVACCVAAMALTVVSWRLSRA